MGMPYMATLTPSQPPQVIMFLKKINPFEIQHCLLRAKSATIVCEEDQSDRPEELAPHDIVVL